MAVAILALAASSVLAVTGYDVTSRMILLAATCIMVLLLLTEMIRKLYRGDFGLDLIAALAMASSIIFGEYLAGAIVGLMYAGGQFLEHYAYRRAQNGMSALLERVPRTAWRLRPDGLEEIPIEHIEVGDDLMIRKGDVIPADGILISESGNIDKAVLTGESLPQAIEHGSFVPSGASNAGEAITIKVRNSVSDSTYAGIIRLVDAASRSKSRLMRLADRYAVWFLILTLCFAAAAVIFSGDLSRIVAVLVVATPCPLILAVPVAFASGASKAAKHGVLIKGAAPLETLSEISVVVLDKTGTLTSGQPEVVRVDGPQPPDRVIQLAASLDQASNHVVGAALVGEAKRRGVSLHNPENVIEEAGSGIRGIVSGESVEIGSGSFFSVHGSDLATNVTNELSVIVKTNGVLIGIIYLQDKLRSDAGEFIEQLCGAGVTRMVLASGDVASAAKMVADMLALDDVKSGLTPSEKVQVVRAESRNGTVLMIGDGVNDAPALAAADVGVAVGSHNLAAAAEAADVVLLNNSLTSIPDTLNIAKRTKKIALQSVYVGMGLSILAMAFAAMGYLPPVSGAILQEVIDVAVILNALRALK